MQNYFKKNTPSIDYKKWGMAGMLLTSNINQDNLQAYIDQTSHIVDLSQFILTNCAQVQHYQGKYKPAHLIWLRFEPIESPFHGLGGPHISVTIDIETKQLKGLVRMLPELNDANFVSCQQALETGIIFLSKQAPDLVHKIKEIPILHEELNYHRIEFSSPYINYDAVQLRWIGKHKEVLFKTQQIVSGIKVKMYLPKNGLWCWVIIDKFNGIMAFERDISWNFFKMRRNTQMWLHDHWLQKNNILNKNQNVKLISS